MAPVGNSDRERWQFEGRTGSNGRVRDGFGTGKRRGRNVGIFLAKKIEAGWAKKMTLTLLGF